MSNLQESEAGTNPTRADTDGDGYSDGEELRAPSLTGMHASDPLDPNSVPTPVTDEERIACENSGGEFEMPLENLSSEDDAENEVEEEPLIPMCGAQQPQVPTKSPELYGPWSDPDTFGSGILYHPCKKKYTYCIKNIFPGNFGPGPKNSAILSLQMWVGAARRCLTDCPPISETTFVEINTENCDGADLKIEYGGEGGSCWGGTNGQFGKGWIELKLWADFETFLHEVGHASGFHHSQLSVGPSDGGFCPIMSYSNPQPNCLHPFDADRACKLAAQYWGRYRDDGKPGRVCGKKEECCVSQKIASVVNEDKGYRRACWPIDQTGNFILDQLGMPPEGEPKYTECSSNKDVCTQCAYEDKTGRHHSWSVVPVPETDPTSKHYGFCKLALFCADPKVENQKYYPGAGFWYRGKWIETKNDKGEVISKTLACI